MFIHTCEICGKEFESRSNRAKYCENCRDKAQVLRNKAYIEKKKSGTSITIGSEQICPICRKTYTVTAGSQKCCKDCQKKQIALHKKSPDSKYLKEKYESLKIYVPNGECDAIKSYAQNQGLSVNKLFLTALEEYKKNHG